MLRALGWAVLLTGCATTSATTTPRASLDTAVADALRGNERLSPLFFPDGATLDARVAAKARALGERTFQQLGVPGATLVDVMFAGSLASYEYTDDSDVDVHVLVEFGPACDPKLRDAWLRSVNAGLHLDVGVSYLGRPVQVTVRDSDDDQGGTWSVLHGAWRHQPVRKPVTFTEAELRAQVSAFLHEREQLVFDWSHDTGGFDCDRFKAPQKRMRELRGEGLKAGGVTSLGNMTYRLVRRLGYFEELEAKRLDCVHRHDSL